MLENVVKRSEFVYIREQRYTKVIYCHYYYYYYYLLWYLSYRLLRRGARVGRETIRTRAIRVQCACVLIPTVPLMRASFHDVIYLNAFFLSFNFFFI